MADKHSKLKEKIEKVCTNFSPGSNEMNKFYDEWAKDYNQDVCSETIQYITPEIGAKTLVQFLEGHAIGTSCRILDVGSGTGLVAEHLRTLNYTNVDALEPSEGSCAVAKSKDLYRNFIVEKLEPGKQVSISSDTYDAAICMGVFTLGHVKAHGMDEMLRVVRSGGLICFSIRDDVMFKEEYGYEKKIAELCEHNTWKLLSKRQEAYQVNRYDCYMFVCQVL